MKRISLIIIALAFVTDGFSQFDLLKDLDYKNGQKTGFFLDQKYNRAAIRKIAAGAQVNVIEAIEVNTGSTDNNNTAEITSKTAKLIIASDSDVDGLFS